jgi:hypothetical protein
MSQDESDQVLSDLVWKHIAAEEHDKAEATIRRRIAIADPTDAMLLWHLFGLLASTLRTRLVLNGHQNPYVLARRPSQSLNVAAPRARDVL